MKRQDALRICGIAVIAVLGGHVGAAAAGAPLEAIPFRDVAVTGAFWKGRLEVNHRVTIPYNFRKCNELGLINNFSRAAGFMPAETFQPNSNNRPSRECDVYKTIEGASYVLATHPDDLLDLYLDSLIDQARTTGYVTTLLKRRRYLPEIMSPQPNLRQFAERMAINAPLQGTAADLIKVAMVRIDRRLAEEGLKAAMIMQVHDELVFEVPAGEAEALAGIVRREMEGAFPLQVPLQVEIAAGKNWDEAHA